MNRSECKKLDWWRWGHGTGRATDTCRGGYLRRCRKCGAWIYMKNDYDGQWRPYESWFDGEVEEGEWRLHDCRG